MSLETFSEILSYSSPFILFIGFLIGTRFYKNLDKQNKLLYYYLSGCLIIDVISRIIAFTSGNNLILFQSLCFLEIIIFSKFYYNMILKNNFIKILSFLGIIYILFEFFYLDFKNIKSVQSYSQVVSSFIIILMVLFYFIEQIEKDFQSTIHDFYFNGVVLFFFTVQLLLLLPFNFLVTNHSSFVFLLWLIHIVTLISFYTYLIISIWKNGKSLKQLRFG